MVRSRVGLEARSDWTFIKYPKRIMMHWWRLKISLLRPLEHGCYYQSFQLSNDQKREGFNRLSDNVSANQDEEVWMDVEAYTDHMHMDNVISKVMEDKRALSTMKGFLDLLSPGFSPIRAEFRRLAG